MRYRKWQAQCERIALNIGALLQDPGITLTRELEKHLREAQDTWSDISRYWIPVRYVLEKRGIVWPKTA